MTISNWISRSLFAAFILLAATLPTAVFAAVKITNVMYNPPGADTGHEWIEIANTGTTSVSLSGYRLFEGGVNHKLTVAIGTTSLPAGASAIIATDPAQYKADHPLFAGAVFKSSFSLSNTGETIELKDPSLVVVDTYSYTAPLIVKEPAPAKVVKSAKATSTTTVKTSTSKKSSYAAGANQAAASLALPALPAIPVPWLYGMGLAALLILGAGAALYARPAGIFAATSGPSEEFELE